MDKDALDVNRCTVFVSSSDAYADRWPAFFSIFKREWPSFTGRIYLNTEQKSFTCDGLDIICTRVGRQRHFGETLHAGLDCVQDGNTILFFMIDYFFEGRVDVDKLNRLYRRFHEDSVDALFLMFQKPKAAEPIEGLPDCVHAIPPFNSICFSFQAAFWNKAKLHSLVASWEDPWNAEFYSFLRMRFRRPCPKIWIYQSNALPILYDAAGVLHGGGRWLQSALKKIDLKGIGLNLGKRQFYHETSHENFRIVWHDIRPSFSNLRSLLSVCGCALRSLLRCKREDRCVN